MKKITIWTYQYEPFMFGGDLRVPVKTEIETEALRRPLGKGYFGYELTSPGGKTVVAEAETGAFVGPNLKAVRKDIKTGDDKIMKDQMRLARREIKVAKFIEAKDFWRMWDK